MSPNTVKKAKQIAKYSITADPPPSPSVYQVYTMTGNRGGNTLLIKTFSHFILGLPSVEQDCNRGQLHFGKEISGEFAITRRL